jgi:hypothetical protein
VTNKWYYKSINNIYFSQIPGRSQVYTPNTQIPGSSQVYTPNTQIPGRSFTLVQVLQYNTIRQLQKFYIQKVNIVD